MGRRNEEYTVLPPNAHSPCYRIRWGDDPKRSAISLHTCDKREAYKKGRRTPRERNKKTLTLEDYVNQRELFVWGSVKYVSNRIAEGYAFPIKTVKQHWGHLHNYILPKFGSASRGNHTNGVRRLAPHSQLANGTKNHIRNAFKIVMELACEGRPHQTNPICRPSLSTRDSIRPGTSFPNRNADILLRQRGKGSEDLEAAGLAGLLQRLRHNRHEDG